MQGDDKIIPINIESEMKSAYIDYSMSVIVSRALPDVRDGFKPAILVITIKHLSSVRSCCLPDPDERSNPPGIDRYARQGPY